MQIHHFLLAFFLAGFLDLGLYLVAVRWFQSDVAPLLTGLQFSNLMDRALKHPNF